MKILMNWNQQFCYNSKNHPRRALTQYLSTSESTAIFLMPFFGLLCTCFKYFWRFKNWSLVRNQWMCYAFQVTTLHVGILLLDTLCKLASSMLTHVANMSDEPILKGCQSDLELLWMISIFLPCQVLLLDPHITNSDDTDTNWLNPTHCLT